MTCRFTSARINILDVPVWTLDITLMVARASVLILGVVGWASIVARNFTSRVVSSLVRLNIQVLAVIVDVNAITKIRIYSLTSWTSLKGTLQCWNALTSVLI
jgi:hypothetical protein